MVLAELPKRNAFRTAHTVRGSRLASRSDQAPSGALMGQFLGDWFGERFLLRSVANYIIVFRFLPSPMRPSIIDKPFFIYLDNKVFNVSFF